MLVTKDFIAADTRKSALRRAAGAGYKSLQSQNQRPEAVATFVLSRFSIGGLNRFSLVENPVEVCERGSFFIHERKKSHCRFPKKIESNTVAMPLYW